MEIYSYETALDESLKYFDGDSLAATTWINKYALRNQNGQLLESNPQMMHDRIIKELMRIETGYNNPRLTEEILREYFYKFKYVIPGGSSMSGIGNNFKFTSLSNCFVIESPLDSYGGILKSDQELIQLMKRRGGVGLDLSKLRPAHTKVTNDAKTSSGLVSFMERFSNSTREVAQNGRRGALMLSVSINHPDAEDFIDAKLQDGKVTGANISVKLTDKFMQAVKTKSTFVQRFPIDVKDEDLFEIGETPIELDKLFEGKTPGTYYKVINAYKLWMKIIHNVWQKAEPGILFEDTILKESPADYYEGYNTVSTNPCGEIPLTPYDSCRLIAINLFSFVKNPFEKNAEFNFDKLAEVAYYTQRIMDNIIDLETEHIEKIIDKVQNDPEPIDTRKVELDLWKNILTKTKEGRRTGVGITAEGDMLAALGIQYGSQKSIEFCEKVHKTIAKYCYASSVDMSSERGSFGPWNSSELDITEDSSISKFIERISTEMDEDTYLDWKKYGRRNIACLTVAPTGTVSIMTQTTSGIEPAFKCWYTRRRKTSDKEKAVFIDKTGDMFEEFKVFHPKFVEWYRKGYNEENLMYSIEQCTNILSSLPEDQLEIIYKKSPYYKSTAQDIDWVQKVKLQGEIQKWVDHSISVTVNVPKDTTVETVADVYMAAYDCGCKGCTLYRDGSRDGVLITKSNKETKLPNLNVSRPDELEAIIVRFKNGSENWIAFIGLLRDQPYEIFTGKVDDDIRYLPKSVTKGVIKRSVTGPAVNGKYPHRYDFQYEISHGYINTLPDIGTIFRSEFWNYARFISGMLRAGVSVDQVINVINSLNSDMGEVINTWKRGVARALKQFVADGVQSVDKCPDCGANLIYEGGCKKCPDCGHSKCE